MIIGFYRIGFVYVVFGLDSGRSSVIGPMTAKAELETLASYLGNGYIWLIAVNL